MGNQIEHIERHFTIKSVGEDGTFEGYASVFNQEDFGGDTVKKGAFKKGLKKLADASRHVIALWQHDRHQPIGKYNEIYEDDTGLFFRGKLTLSVQKAQEAYDLMRDDVIDGISIGGFVRKEHLDRKTFKRDLIEIELREASVVTFPMLDSARVLRVKSEIANITDVPDIETMLRDVGGFSQWEAKMIISNIKKAGDSHRDVDDSQASIIKTIRETINNLKG